MQLLFYNSPERHPQATRSCAPSEGPAPLVGWFEVDLKEGSRKERITLNHGEPSELQRMLVPFSLFIPFNEVHSGFFCPPPASEAAITICKSSCGSDPSHSKFAIGRRALSWSMVTQFGVGTQPHGLEPVAHKTWLRVHFPGPVIKNLFNGGRAWTWMQFWICY